MRLLRRRDAGVALLLALALVLGLAAPAGPNGARAQQWFWPVEIGAAPITAFRIGSEETRFGELEFLGGLVLTSPDGSFGSLSGLDIGGDGRLLAVTDTGLWFSATLAEADGIPLGLADARMAPILGRDGTPVATKEDADAEGLRVTERDGRPVALVVFERNHRLVGFSLDQLPGGPQQRIAMPPHHFGDGNQGIEAVAVAPVAGPLAGAIVLVSETATARGIPGFVLDGPREGAFFIRPSDGFEVSDAAFLPDGDLLLLERRFALLAGFAMRLRRIAAADIRPGGSVDGPVMLTADSGYDIDNMEGLAVRPAPAELGVPGGALITLIADDNGTFLERTVLLQFLWRGVETASAPPDSGG